jgi:hypothetical protein
MAEGRPVRRADRCRSVEHERCVAHGGQCREVDATLDGRASHRDLGVGNTGGSERDAPRAAAAATGARALGRSPLSGIEHSGRAADRSPKSADDGPGRSERQSSN